MHTKNVGNFHRNTVLLTWPGELRCLLVHHLLDSASKQHPRGVMVEGLQGFAGAVGFLSGNSAGSLVPVSGGGGVTPLAVLVSLAVSFPLSLALGQRAERPLLPHPFHAACMLGIPLPPLHHRHSSKKALTTGLFHAFPGPLPLFLGCDPRPVNDFLSKFLLPRLLNLARSLFQSFQPSTWKKKKERWGKEARNWDNTNPSAPSSKAHTYLPLIAPEHLWNFTHEVLQKRLDFPVVPVSVFMFP